MVDHFDYKQRCPVEKNVPIAFILPSRWRDGAESLGMERTSCLWLWITFGPSLVVLHLPKFSMALAIGDEQLDRPNSETWMEWYHASNAYFVWTSHKHNSLPLGLIHPLYPSTKELHSLANKIKLHVVAYTYLFAWSKPILHQAVTIETNKATMLSIVT